MNCTTQIEGTKGIIKLEGRFSFEAGAAFKAHTQALLGQGGVSELNLDFSGVTHLESSALGLLLLLREKAEARGVRVVLLEPSPAVRAIFNVVQFGKLFEIRN